VEDCECDYRACLSQNCHYAFTADKTSSQHGAAARAFDCFSLRRYQPKGMRSVHLGDEEPYMTEKEAQPLPTMPDDIRNKVEAQRRRIATHRTQAASINGACFEIVIVV